MVENEGEREKSDHAEPLFPNHGLTPSADCTPFRGPNNYPKSRLKYAYVILEVSLYFSKVFPNLLLTFLKFFWLSGQIFNKFYSNILRVVESSKEVLIQGLNDEGRCCEVHAQTLPKIPTLAAMEAVNEICQCYHFQKQKIAKNSKFIENGHIIYQSIWNFM